MLKQSIICSIVFMLAVGLSGCEKKETQITIERGAISPEAVKPAIGTSHPNHSGDHSSVIENPPAVLVAPPAESNAIVDQPAPVVRHHMMMAPVHRGEEVHIYNQNHP